MSTYVIGDVHGCFIQFQRLLKRIKYSPNKDKIILTGDLVNRGPESLAMINFCLDHSNINTVLGNHDLYLLYLLSIDSKRGKLKKVVSAPNNKRIFKWLLSKPLFIKIKDIEKQRTFFITHAGIPEIWSPDKAYKLANETSNFLKKNPKRMLESMWGNHPNKWNDKLKDEARHRTIINYFTRMRFLRNGSEMDLKTTGTHAKKGFKPWFNYESHKYTDKNHYYIFGHWATLKGKTKNKHFVSLDTGCVWKGKLSAIRLEDLKKFSINY